MDITFYEDACYFAPTNPSLQEEKHTFLEEKSCEIQLIEDEDVVRVICDPTIDHQDNSDRSADQAEAPSS